MEVCPVYWSKAVNILHPYASLAYAHILNMLDILCRTAQPLVDFCHTYVTQLLAAVSYSVLLFFLCYM